MNYLTIIDNCGIPLEVSNGLYLHFAACESDTAKAQVMRDYRLLPCDKTPFGSSAYLDGAKDVFICDDTSEYDAMRHVLNTCSRLAAFGFSRYKGKRKPEAKDLNEIDGLAITESGASLCINLDNSYWYKRYLFQALDGFDYVPADNVFAPIINYDLESALDATGRGSLEQSENGVTLTSRGLELTATGETLEDTAANLANTLLTLHTSNTAHFFNFDNGFLLTAPLGIMALWADYAACFAKRPITICKVCGLPVVENHPPRGEQRVYCSNACRMKDKRREKKKALDRKRATKQ